jgi:hypothetical protein
MENIKQLVLFNIFNPPTGQINLSGGLVNGLILSNKRCLLLAHELINIFYGTSAGYPLFEIGYFGININLSGENINDAISGNFIPNTQIVNYIQTMFVFNNRIPESVRPLNIVIEPNQNLNISYAGRLIEAPVTATNGFQFLYRLFWQELE